MRTIAAFLLVTTVGCSGMLRTMDVGTTAAALMTTACDFGQTMSAASQGWSNGRSEANEMMGGHPDTGMVAAYFTGVLITELMVAALPRKIHMPLLGGVVIAETNTIAGNLNTTTGTCGIR